MGKQDVKLCNIQGRCPYQHKFDKHQTWCPCNRLTHHMEPKLKQDLEPLNSSSLHGHRCNSGGECWDAWKLDLVERGLQGLHSLMGHLIQLSAEQLAFGNRQPFLTATAVQARLGIAGKGRAPPRK
eukprot:880910-Pelagomonas_calceolata.AAC.1